MDLPSKLFREIGMQTIEDDEGAVESSRVESGFWTAQFRLLGEQKYCIVNDHGHKRSSFVPDPHF